MTDHQQYTPDPASVAQFSRLWSAHLDDLDHHLSTDMWALVAVTVALITFPVARIVVPALLHAVVPDAVRAVFNLI